MKRACRFGSLRLRWLLPALLAIVPACGRPPAATPEPENPLTAATPAADNRTRAPAVAGLFYPADPRRLAETVDRHLAAAPTNRLEDVRALIAPHAGYDYSGPVAGCAYQQVVGRGYETVVILAASHYAAFRGASIPATEAYQTPLGRVRVSPKARRLAQTPPFVLEPRCRVQRPRWAGVTPATLPAAGEDTPETWEHSVEVQIPFLQRALSEFNILPVVFGDADPLEVARALVPWLDDRTLVVASTDLSHYHPYNQACVIDRQTVQAICSLDLDRLTGVEAEEAACGRRPVMTLLHLARLQGWQARLLDYRNSGDTSGDKRAVVGYAAIAFSGASNAPPPIRPLKPGSTQVPLDPKAQEYLLALARQTLTEVTANRTLPEIAPATVPAACSEAKGCFVTLTRQGELRGCIGNLLPQGPLYLSVIRNTRNAALEDPRFRPVTSAEARLLRIEISVLTVPQPLTFSSPEELLARLQAPLDGVVLGIGDHLATFLPQVWEQFPDKTEFLNHLAAKGGSPPLAWRGKDVHVSTYRVQAFAEPR